MKRRPTTSDNIQFPIHDNDDQLIDLTENNFIDLSESSRFEFRPELARAKQENRPSTTLSHDRCDNESYSNIYNVGGEEIVV